MRRSIYRKAFVGFLFCAAVLLSGIIQDAHAYRGPFEGRVVDQDTLEPIEGAVVFVELRSYSITMLLAAHSVSYFYDAQEVLTDSKGHFYIPKNWSWNPWTTFVMDSMVTIFKAGYGHVVISWDTALEEATIKEKKGAIYNMRLEKGTPIFLLKRITTKKERSMGVPMIVGSEVPNEKKHFLMNEIEKDKLLLSFK